MSTVVVRYRPRADMADENQRLVEAVFAELAATQPNGLGYATFRLEDGTFVHIAEVDGDNPLAASPAFAAFQEGIQNRCDPGDGPNAQPAELIGNYGLMS
jgi:hypothetical protein